MSDNVCFEFLWHASGCVPCPSSDDVFTLCSCTQIAHFLQKQVATASVAFGSSCCTRFFFFVKIWSKKMFSFSFLSFSFSFSISLEKMFFFSFVLYLFQKCCIAGISIRVLGRLLAGGHDPTHQSGVEAPRLLKRSHPDCIIIMIVVSLFQALGPQSWLGNSAQISVTLTAACLTSPRLGSNVCLCPSCATLSLVQTTCKLTPERCPTCKLKTAEESP